MTSTSTSQAGEVVGIAGLMGAGRTEFAMSVFGRSYGHRITGEVLMDGKPVDVSTVRKAIDAGLAYVTEDRKHLGLVLDDNIMHNTTLANLDGVSQRGVSSMTIKEMKVADRLPHQLRIRSLRHLPGDGEPFGRQPAEGRAVEMAVLRSGSADPRRADTRHRCRREI